VNYAGSAVAVTSKVFSLDLNPTLAYKLTPDITIGVGAQVEYFKIRLNKSASLGLIPGFPPASAARSYDADDWGFGATAGIIWTPTRTTTIGLGYRSAVSVDPSGSYIRGAQINAATRGITPGVATTATGAIDLPDEVTLSLRQMVSPRLALLGTVEWTNWSRVGNVTAKGAGCGPTGACETLNLNYKDGWLFSGGLEYAWSPSLTLRTGVGYEISPIDSSTRNILLPDSDRIHVSVGASYKYSDRITLDIGYSHLFMEDNARFCTAAPNALAPTTHCVSPTQLTLLSGTADASIDILSFGLKYNISGPVTPLEPYK
jgi:long-chain fatty acid transport protein